MSDADDEEFHDCVPDGAVGSGEELAPAKAASAAEEPTADDDILRAAAISALDVARTLHRQGRHVEASRQLPSEQWLSALGACEDAEDIRRFAKQAEQALILLNAGEEGWILSRDDASGDRLRCLYKHTVGDPWYQFKIEGTVDSDLSAVTSVAREFDLIKTWNKYILDTSILASKDLLDLIVYGGIWLPWPLAARDFTLAGHGYDLFDENGVLVFVLKTTDWATDGLPSAAAGRIHALFEYAVVRLEPLDEDGEMRTRVTIVCLMDPKMPGNIEAPAWVLKWVLKVMTPFMFQQANKLVVNIMKNVGHGAQWQTRMAQNPELYELLRKREDETRARLGRTGAATSAVQKGATAERRRMDIEAAAEAQRLEAAVGEAAAGEDLGWELDEAEMEAASLEASKLSLTSGNSGRSMRGENRSGRVQIGNGGGRI